MASHPPIDPELAVALTEPGLTPASLLPEDIPARRAESNRTAWTIESLARAAAVEVSERVIPGPAGSIDLLILRPAGVAGGERQHRGPGVVFIHGGGMVKGSRFSLEPTMIDAVSLGATVVSCEYRLAPEDPYPAPLDDCAAAWRWAAEHAADLDLDPQFLALAGSSAGGGLAAGVTLRARDMGAPMPSHLILFAPMLDDREITPSSTELDGEGRWDRTTNRTGWSSYLAGRHGHDEVPSYAAPARATDLSSLPPTFIDVGQVDTFRDEDIEFAARLARAGVPVEFHLWPGAVHGFTGLAPHAQVSQAAEAARRSYLTRAGLTGAGLTGAG